MSINFTTDQNNFLTTDNQIRSIPQKNRQRRKGYVDIHPDECDSLKVHKSPFTYELLAVLINNHSPRLNASKTMLRLVVNQKLTYINKEHAQIIHKIFGKVIFAQADLRNRTFKNYDKIFLIVTEKEKKKFIKIIAKINSNIKDRIKPHFLNKKLIANLLKISLKDANDLLTLGLEERSFPGSILTANRIFKKHIFYSE